MYDYELDAGKAKEVVERGLNGVSEAQFVLSGIKTYRRLGELEILASEVNVADLEKECQKIIREWRKDFDKIAKMSNMLNTLEEKYDIKIIRNTKRTRWEVRQNGGLLGIIEKSKGAKK